MLPVSFPQPCWMYERGGLGCCRVVPLCTATIGCCALHCLPARASSGPFLWNLLCMHLMSQYARSHWRLAGQAVMRTDVCYNDLQGF